jgi:hypothetical protein
MGTRISCEIGYMVAWVPKFYSALKDRDNIPLLLEARGWKVVLNWLGWNLPPHANHWLATRWNGAAAHWSDPYLFWQTSVLTLSSLAFKLSAPICHAATGQIQWRRNRSFPSSAISFMVHVTTDILFLCPCFGSYFLSHNNANFIKTNRRLVQTLSWFLDALTHLSRGRPFGWWPSRMILPMRDNHCLSGGGEAFIWRANKL